MAMYTLIRQILFIANFYICVSTLQYDVGVTYEYRYLSTVRLTEPLSHATEVTFQVSSLVELRPVWQKDANQQLFLLKMTPRLLVKPKGKTEFQEHPSPLDSQPFNPVVFGTFRGRITHFYANPNENLDLLNIKRAVVSLFQLQQVTGNTDEVDASGKCSVLYKLSGKSTTKTKKSCIYNFAKDFLHSNKIFDSHFKHSQEIIYQLSADDFVIQAAESDERIQYQLDTVPDTAATIFSRQKISLLRQIQDASSFDGYNLEEVVQSISSVMNIELVKTDLMLSESSTVSTSRSLSDFIRDRKEVLSNKRLSKVKSAYSFLQILRRFRYASKNEILEVLKDPKNKNILSSLLDIAAAVQTPEALHATLEILPKILKPDVIERFLLALAVTPRPTEETINGVQSLINRNVFSEPKLVQTATLVLASLIRVYCQNQNNDCNEMSPLINTLTSNLDTCSDETCYVMNLRALQNAAQPHTIPHLLAQVKKGGKIATWALQALKAISAKDITADVKNLMLQVYNQVQRRYDSTARLHAADIILSNDPNDEELRVIMKVLEDVNEMSTYLMNRIREVMAADESIRSKVENILKDSRMNNYDLIAQPGISTAFTNLLAETGNKNATYGLHLELAKGGLLKQSVFDVEVNNERGNLHLMAFGIFASGLSGLSGDVSPEVQEEDEGDATAGIELAIMGVALRPYVFFVGQADLMSHVWSGTASEPTNIMQGNLLLHDEQKYVALSSGFVLKFATNGVLSVKMDGSLQVSLWSRNSHSDIITKAAFVVQGYASLQSTLVRSSIELSTASEASLSFVTDTEFYEAPFKMCTQMIQPDVPIKYTVRKIESIPETKHRVRRTKRWSYTTPGKCYALHPKNSAQCGIMLK